MSKSRVKRKKSMDDKMTKTQINPLLLDDMQVNKKMFTDDDEMNACHDDNDVHDVSVDYCGKVFIRSHCKANNVYDNETSIWSALFLPPNKHKSEMVATCGGNSICIIDCLKGKVSKRYTDEDVEDVFVSLACIPCNGSNSGEETNCETLLASGSMKNKILLFSLNSLKCYERIESAHEDHINSLVFHPTHCYWLFSASYDQQIKLWQVFEPNDSRKHELLVRINTEIKLLSICYSLKFNTLVACGEPAVFFWHDVNVDDNKSSYGELRVRSGIIDGLQILADDPNRVAMRISSLKNISIIDLNLVSEEIQNVSKVTKFNVKKLSLKNIRVLNLKWGQDSIQHFYIYMAAQKGLLVSGAPHGQMWLYRTNRFRNHYRHGADDNTLMPDKILEWPEIENCMKYGKGVVDESKPVVVNTVTISHDLKYIVGGTNNNLICIWERV